MGSSDVGVAVGSLATMEWANIVSQVFGGCCSNVFLLERLILNNVSQEYSLGTLITFCQFLGVAILSYWPQINTAKSSWRRLYLKENVIPISKWMVSVVLFFCVSLLNNLVWRFEITIPIHIIFRSCGTIITMMVGYFLGGKRYNTGQCVSSIIITLGCILGTLPGSSSTNGQDVESTAYSMKFLFGLFILVFACFLSALMGLYNENLFKQYGNHWQESLFYLHFLGLPLFLIGSPTIYNEFILVWTSPVRQPIIGSLSVSRPFLDLIFNVVTQFICIRGVSMLAGSTLALTVTVVLLVRKFVSLFISVLYFGNKISSRAVFGALGVFMGALMYTLSSGYNNKRAINKKTQ